MGRTLGIMQPYFFPYIAYFQLIEAVDLFVCYNDVNFITRGWINRNNVLVNGRPKYFTVPCRNASQNKLICEIKHALDEKGKSKLLKTLKFSYANAPYFKEVFSLVETVLNYDTERIDLIAIKSIEMCMNYLDIDTKIKVSASTYDNRAMEKEDRLIDICKREGADRYINAAGGQEIYEKSYFRHRGIELYFLESEKISYKQFNHPYISNLSIIDVMMFNSPDFITQDLLKRYSLR